MITMTLGRVSVPGARLRVEPVVETHARAWKQRPGVRVLGAFGPGVNDIDNSTGVSAVEGRHT